jgi:hypothetical protein
MIASAARFELMKDINQQSINEKAISILFINLFSFFGTLVGSNAIGATIGLEFVLYGRLSFNIKHLICIKRKQLKS